MTDDLSDKADEMICRMIYGQITFLFRKYPIRKRGQNSVTTSHWSHIAGWGRKWYSKKGNIKYTEARRNYMERVCKFLKDAGVYYLATVEGDQPRVRPFGTAHIFDGKLYIQTGKVKPCSRQILENPKVEISAFHNGTWIRLAGELVEDDRVEAKKSMLDAYPNLRGMYNENDGNTQVLYFKNAVATFSSFTAAPETVTF